MSRPRLTRVHALCGIVDHDAQVVAGRGVLALDDGIAPAFGPGA